MSNMETIEFSALGARLRLASGDNPEQLLNIIELVQQRIAKVTDAAPNAQPIQVALLAALDISEELLKEREQERTECNKAVNRVRSLLESLG
ncbi:MAG: cell division protein ZapA [bacterium]